MRNDIEAQSMRNADSHRERLNTHQEYLITSMQSSGIRNTMQKSNVVDQEFKIGGTESMVS